MSDIRWSRLLRNQVLVAVMAMTVLVPVLFSASIADRIPQSLAYGAFGLILLVVFLFRISSEVTWKEAGRLAVAGPNLPILLYLLWNAGCVARSSLPYLSRIQFIPLACGVVLYAATALQARRKEELGLLFGTLITVAAGAVVAAFLLDREHRMINLAGSFHDQQLFGSFLMLLLPVSLGMGAAARNTAAKLAARLVAALVAIALLMTGCRSSWAGAAAGGVVFAVLSVLFVIDVRGLARRKHELAVMPIVTVVLVLLFITLSGSWRGITDRVHSISTISATRGDDSLHVRVELWRVALRVIAARPVTGWGPGVYAWAQVPYNPASRPASDISLTGPSLSESPHNSYLQLAAEQGLVGLALYLALIGAALAYGVRMLRRLQSPFRQYAVIGCLAAVCGHLVDGIGNPAWFFPEVSMFFWLILGLGMGAAGLGGLPDDLDAEPSHRSTRRSRSRRSRELAVSPAP